MKDFRSTPARTAPMMQRPSRTSDGQPGAFRPNFVRHLVRSISGVSFPLAGSIIVIYTLSGDTRRVAIVATTIAIMGHVVHSMMDLSERDQRRAAEVRDASGDGPEAIDMIE